MWFTQILLSLCVLGLAGLGWPFVRMWCRRTCTELDGASTFGASLALALIFVQAGGMILGFTATLTKLSVGGWLVLGIAGALSVWVSEGRPLPEIPRASTPALILGVIIVGYLLMATVPPWYRDEMVYHLALPRGFAIAGGYTQPDDNIFAALPLGWESILALLHALGDAPDHFPPLNPRLVGAWTSVGAALAASGLSTVLGASPSRAPWTAVLFLLTPSVAEFGPSAYVESYLILLSILALHAAIRVIGGEPCFVAPAAFFAGIAASTKYTGIAVCLLIWALLLANALGRSREAARLEMRRAASFGFIAALLGSPFYIRNVLERGNPVFPLCYDIFGGRGWDARRDWAYGRILAHYGMGRDLIDYFLLPARLFVAKSFKSGFEGSLGPVVGLGAMATILLTTPFFPRLHRPRMAASGFAVLWSVFWASSVQQARFYLVAVAPLLALLLAWIDDLNTRLRRAARWVLPAVFLGSLAWAAPLVHTIWDRQNTSEWLQGKTDREAILSRMLPESYPLEAEIESIVPPEGRIWLVWMKGYTYYFRRAYRVDMVFEAERFEALLDESADGETVLTQLRRDGITHLLIQHGLFLKSGSAELRPGRSERLRGRFEEMLQMRALRRLRLWGTIALYEVEG